MAIVYYVVMLFLGWEFYRIYQAQGGAAVGVSAMGLGQAAFAKVEEVRSLVKEARHHDKDKDNDKPKSD